MTLNTFHMFYGKKMILSHDFVLFFLNLFWIFSILMILAIFLRKYISYSSRSGHDSSRGLSDMSPTNSESLDVDADGDQPLSTHFRIHGNDLLLL